MIPKLELEHVETELARKFSEEPVVMGAHQLNELAWARRIAFALKAEYEHRLWDGTRIDLLTETAAVEIDWAPKWAEAIGQCLWYSTMVQLEPVVLLLVEDMGKESKYVYRALTVCHQIDIEVWIADTKKEILTANGKHFPIGPPVAGASNDGTAI